MTSDDGGQKTVRNQPTDGVRNPFGMRDVPDPDSQEVEAFAETIHLDGSATDENASEWFSAEARAGEDSIEGKWSSRWNGGPDPAIPDDTKEKWKPGQAAMRVVADRVYVLFDWNSGARRGLLEARRESSGRLIGKYINLTSPGVTAPWVGLIVNNRRIDGRHPGGRLDFRR